MTKQTAQINAGATLENLRSVIDTCNIPRVIGEIVVVRNLYMEALLPGISMGSRVKISTSRGNSIAAEVISLDGSRVGLAPLASTSGVAVGDSVEQTNNEDFILCGPGLLGRVVDPLSNPLDAKGVLKDVRPWAMNRSSPPPLSRLDVDEQLITGIKVIDGCLALGEGQRVALIAGPGMGKTTIIGTMAARATCDVSVICLVGERGREVREFLDDLLGTEGLERSVVIVAAADDPPMLKAKALAAATSTAEWFRARGDNVLLVVDSLTRVVRAKRDVALTLGDVPARNGHPVSSFADLPSLFERAGRNDLGSITAVYAVLIEGGEKDPLAEEVRSLADGHIVLSGKLAQAGSWPAVDFVESVSRVMPRIVTKDQLLAAAELRRVMSAYQKNEDLILMGAYRSGTCRDTDAALKNKKKIERFLRQPLDKISTSAETKTALLALAKFIS